MKKENLGSVKALKKQLGAAVAMVCVAAVALGSSTYAWFVTNTKVTAGKAEMTATAANTLLISAAGQNEWATSYDFTDKNVSFAPVSTIGTADGTAFTFYKQLGWAKDADQNNAITVNKVAALTENEVGTATGQDATPLYYQKSFDIKAAQACKLYLDTETVFGQLNEQNQLVAATEGTLNKTLRLGLVITDADGKNGKTVIYQVDKTANGTAANRFNTTLASTNCNGIANAVSAVGTDGAITAAKMAVTVPADKDIVTASALATADAANGLNATVNDADVLYNFTKANEICKVTAYIWMEGCDYDCTNNTVAEITGDANKIVANLGFCAGN